MHRVLGSVAFSIISSVLLASFVQAKPDDLCYLENTPGQRVSLSSICGKSGKGKVDDSMWDENNYDPNFVWRGPYGIWMVKPGGSKPFRYPDGGIIWPDERITHPDGVTLKPVGKGNEIIGIQYYKADKVTPLQPGEKMTLPSGQIIKQQSF
jgi:hypothetical protein